MDIARIGTAAQRPRGVADDDGRYGRVGGEGDDGGARGRRARCARRARRTGASR